MVVVGLANEKFSQCSHDLKPSFSHPLRAGWTVALFLCEFSITMLLLAAKKNIARS
jgi:hypothetical protein